jgi:hypothetical protein
VDFDKLDRMVGDPRFISGIYNYCDRWCERCEFTTRCLTYTSVEDTERELKRLKKKGVEEDLPEESLPELPPLPEPNIQQTPPDADAAEDEEDFKEWMEEEEKVQERVRTHPISQASWAYMEMVDAWLKAHGQLFNEEGELCESAAKAELPGVASDDELVAFQDAIEVIRWYHHFIAAKSHRALHGEDRDDILDDDGTPFPRDSDGSAKVCLLGIDRSIEAWSTLRDLLPARSEGIIETLAHLNRLRHAIEEEFPNARAFIRPGFDGPIPPAAPARKKGRTKQGPRARQKKGTRGNPGSH